MNRLSIALGMTALFVCAQARAAGCPHKAGAPVSAKVKIDFKTRGKTWSVQKTVRGKFPANARRANGGSRLIGSLPAVDTGIHKDARTRFNFVPRFVVVNPDSASCTLEVQLSINGRGSFAEPTTPFTISGAATAGGKSFPIHQSMTVSCFEEGTSIALADGTSARVEELTAGEAVRNPLTGEAVAIAQVIRGEEYSSFVELEVEGKVLRVTGDHAMPTARGLLQARSLRPGDRVLAAGGLERAVARVTKVPVRAMRRVYNLELQTGSAREADHYLLANGIVAGDQFLQDRVRVKLASTR
jgi:hypothetical protein